jgi:4-hydroxy-L-threonine phosphate dehydrogenase PdxA
MLIFNEKLSVCPITTHTSIFDVSKKISKRKIIDNVKLIYNFYKKIFNIDPIIAVTGLNPHCESKTNEEKNIIIPAIKSLSKSNIRVLGPFSADTIFLKENRKKYDVIIGMYHDQVLAPMKTLFEYDAINITLGLPFIRISPDHGPNENMLGQNKSNSLSLYKALKFLDKR